MTKEQRAALDAVGMCTRCTSKGCTEKKPMPARPGRRSCTGCAADHVRRTKRARGTLMRAKRCACGEIRRRERRTCVECAEVAALKHRETINDLVARGVCVTCRKRPACERAPRRGPKQKRANRSDGAHAAAYDRPLQTKCSECVKRRIEQKEAIAEKKRAGCPKVKVVQVARRNFYKRGRLRAA
jgi:hypothetical protein